MEDENGNEQGKKTLGITCTSCGKKRRLDAKNIEQSLKKYNGLEDLKKSYLCRKCRKELREANENKNE